MAKITGSTTIDWSTISLDTDRFDAALDEFGTRLTRLTDELDAGRFSFNSPPTPTFLSATLFSGGTLTISGSGFDTPNVVINDFNYANGAAGEALRFIGELDGRGAYDVMTSLKIAVPGFEVTYLGNIQFNNLTDEESGTLTSFVTKFGTTTVTIEGDFLFSDGDITGTIQEMRVTSGANTVVMTGLSLSEAALDDVDDADDLSFAIGKYLPGNDTITYTNNSPVGMTFEGGAGNDTITITGPNADTLFGDRGNDVLNGGGGVDSLHGGPGDDVFVYDGTADTFIETPGEGIDQVRSLASFTLPPEVENLKLTGSAGINGTGNELANVIVGNTGDNQLAGQAGDDVLTGSAGSDALDGGDGTDTASYAGSPAAVTVDLAAGIGLGGHAQGDTLVAIENLIGSAFKDTLSGDAGANLLNGAAGADTLIGRVGDDTYVVNSAGDQITELAGEGSDTVRASISYSLEGKELEHLTLTGSAAINATGNDQPNILSGNSAANRLDGKAGGDQTAGANGSDVYLVDDIGDTVTEATAGASGGIDRVESSVDFVLGPNVENLTLLGADNLDGSGNALANTIVGNSGTNQLVGDAGNDALAGKAGDDTLIGGLGNDKMNGGAGSDTYEVNAAGDVVTEALAGSPGGTDTVRASINYRLGANVENLALTGSDNINGTGNALANEIIGNGGDNVLRGRGGNDMLTGADGADRFAFNTAPNAATNVDHITDFASGTDLILLENSVFVGLGSATGALDPTKFVAGADLTAGQDASDRIVYDTTSGELYYDANGSVAGGGVLFAVLDGAPAVAASDFQVT